MQTGTDACLDRLTSRVISFTHTIGDGSWCTILAKWSKEKDKGKVNHPWWHPTFSNKFNRRLGLTTLLNWLSCSRKYNNNMATRLPLLPLTPRILLL